MLSINLYQPGVINKEISFPEKWDELELLELHAISRVLLSDLQGATTAKSIILLEIIKYRAKQKGIPISIVQRLDPEVLARDGLALIEFIYLQNNLTKQPYPILKVQSRRGLFLRLHGPDTDFNNLTAGEYEAAEIYFLQFKDNPAVEHLISLAAVLYRTKGAEFIRYNAANYEYITYPHESQVKHFLKLQPWELFTIYIWYLGCRSNLPLYFPTLHKNGSATAAATDLMIFTKCIHSAAGAKNGTRDQVRRTLLKALFFEMEQEAIKAEELKELYERK